MTRWKRRLRFCADGRDHFLGLHLWCRLIHQLFPIAAFLDAGTNQSNFGFFLNDKIGPALRARLRDRHERRGEITIRIARTAIENARAAASPSAAPAHKFAFVALRAFDAQSDRPRVFALRVAGTTDEFAEAPVLFHQAVSAGGALFIERFVGLPRDARPFHQPPSGFAVRIAGTRQEHAEAAALNRHLLAAVIAIFSLTFGVAFFTQLRRKILNKIAVRIARAAQEKSVPADAFQQFALAALFARFPGRDARFVGEHFVAGAIEIHDKFFPEFLYRFAPVQLAFLDFVEFFFQARGKRHIKYVFKTFHQQDADPFAKHGRRKAALILLDVLAFDNGRYYCRIRGRPANSLFFQVFYQCRFGVAWRRLGEMLFRTDRIES